MNTGNDFQVKDEIVDKKIISDDKQERFKKTAMAMKEIITKKLYKISIQLWNNTLKKYLSFLEPQYIVL